MKTKYSSVNAAFSEKAHNLAQQSVYPKLFQRKREHLKFENTSLGLGGKNRILDGEMGIDRIIKVQVPFLQARLVFTIQERFRREGFAKYQDVTITEWNGVSNTPSELYKINAGLFVYGYYNETMDNFVGDVMIINTAALLLAITKGVIRFTRKFNSKEQSFLTFSFSDLQSVGVVTAKIRA